MYQAGTNMGKKNEKWVQATRYRRQKTRSWKSGFVRGVEARLSETFENTEPDGEVVIFNIH
jgi:hypothetical protein